MAFSPNNPANIMSDVPAPSPPFISENKSPIAPPHRAAPSPPPFFAPQEAAATSTDIPLLKAQALDAATAVEDEDTPPVAAAVHVNIDEITLQPNSVEVLKPSPPQPLTTQAVAPTKPKPTTSTTSVATTTTPRPYGRSSYGASVQAQVSAHKAQHQQQETTRRTSSTSTQRPRVPGEWSTTSCWATCRHCGYSGSTEVTREAGGAVWLACFCLLCFCWPLMWLPFVMDDMHDVVHSCKVCHERLGMKPAL